MVGEAGQLLLVAVAVEQSADTRQARQRRVHSSVVEHSAAIRVVAGSNPAGPCSLGSNVPLKDYVVPTTGHFLVHQPQAGVCGGSSILETTATAQYHGGVWQGSPVAWQEMVGCGHQTMVSTRLELVTLGLLDPRSNQLS